jgi:hypothetical protein
MTAILLAALIVTLALLLCTLVGASQQADDLLARIGYRDARIEDLENELRHQSRAHHPAGRGIGADVIALREALEDRDAGTEPGA